MEQYILSSLKPDIKNCLGHQTDISLDNPRVLELYKRISKELKIKIDAIHEKNPQIGYRLVDYMNTKLNCLDNSDILLENGYISHGEIKKTTKLYLYNAMKILDYGDEQVIQILKQHPPEDKGTSANLKSIEIAFGNMTLTNNNTIN